MLRRVERLVSLGNQGVASERLVRHVRVTNALALVGFVLCAIATPMDAFMTTPVIAASDGLAAVAFGACWMLNARGHRTAARVLLLAAANTLMLFGVTGLRGPAEIRTVFFPLSCMPFVVFGVTERVWLAVFTVLPIAAYFATGVIEVRGASVAVHVYEVYAPILSFSLTIGGLCLFAYVDHVSEQKLREARARELQSARLVALGEMSSGIAHEIRNPLAAIHLAASQIVEHARDPEIVKQLGERAQQIVMRATRIIEALRVFARDGSEDPWVAAPVERIIDDALQLCGKRPGDRGVALTIVRAAPELVVECRPVQLMQVLVNVVGNAYDAVASAGERWIRIDVGTDGDRVELAVTDSGTGIPEPARARIFEPFYTTKAPDRGTGLGLSLSRGLVGAHRGTLELDEASPHTRFVIRIPVAQPRANGGGAPGLA